MYELKISSGRLKREVTEYEFNSLNYKDRFYYRKKNDGTPASSLYNNSSTPYNSSDYDNYHNKSTYEDNCPSHDTSSSDFGGGDFGGGGASSDF